MPRYFFETHDGDTTDPDAEGLNLAGDEAARLEALKVFSDMMRDTVPDGDHRTFYCVVRNAGGSVIYAATLTLDGAWVKPATLVRSADSVVA